MKHLLTLKEFKRSNPRIDGFKKLQEVNAKIAEIYVVPDSIFRLYKKTKKLPEEFVDEVKIAVENLLKNWSGYFLAIRRAYVVPGLENPPGPRFHGANTAEEVLENIKSLFEFAIEHKYDLDPKSQIEAFFHPFIGPEKYAATNSQDSFISYGGYAIKGIGPSVSIFGVFGLNEGVQSLVVDHYQVDENRGRYFIVSKEIPQKNKMLCPTKDAPAVLFDVPVDIQFEQVLSDNEILEVARVVREASEKHGPQRVEFSVNKQGLFFNEAADYWEEKHQPGDENINIKGSVRVVNSVADLDKLSAADRKDLLSGKIIVRVGEDIIANRDYDVLGALAAWKDNLFVLYPGVAATQHAMRVLADKGHRAFLIGNQKFNEGDEAQIIVVGGKVRVTNLSRTEEQQYVSLWDASLLGIGLCGGKADRLSRLKILGFQVPHGAVCTTLIFDKLLQQLGYKESVPTDEFQKIHQFLEKPSEKLVSLISLLLADYISSGKLFSVRSSATVEDDSHDSMAGMFDTFLNIKGNDLSLKVLAVIRSAFATQIAQHLQGKPALVKKLKMAVILQEMVAASCAGVIFGAKPQTGDLNTVEIEAKKGLGEEIVSGRAKQVEQYKFSRLERRVIERKGPEVLSPAQVKALFMLSERLRLEFADTPQDIEWAIDQSGQIWVLQSRDLYLGAAD